MVGYNTTSCIHTWVRQSRCRIKAWWTCHTREYTKHALLHACRMSCFGLCHRPRQHHFDPWSPWLSLRRHDLFSLFLLANLGPVGFKSPGYFGAGYLFPFGFGFWPCAGLSHFPSCLCQCRLSFRLCHLCEFNVLTFVSRPSCVVLCVAGAL